MLYEIGWVVGDGPEKLLHEWVRTDVLGGLAEAHEIYMFEELFHGFGIEGRLDDLKLGHDIATS